MIKKLTKHRNSYSLIIDKALMDLLDIDPETPLEISTTDGQSLIIKPIKGKIFEKEIHKSLIHFKKKYGEALKRLAK
ncbi:MAG: AbrB/MazE/SpoVT family DNA-binding domain-containing protein [Chlamydiales bacterium]|nr:AbrB/MazE/SpoVT family DNA-binding domain-containing protein [Chlamydiales bacterium]